MQIGLRDVAGLAAAGLAAYGRPPTDRASPIAALPIAAICTFLAVIFGLAALVGGGVALWMVALPYLGSLGAALAIAALLLLSSLAMVWITRAQLRSRRTVSAPVAVPPSAEQVLAQGLRLFTEHKGAVLVAPLLAGWATGTTDRAS